MNPSGLLHIDAAQVKLMIARSPRLRDDPINWWLVAYFIVGTLLFYAASSPVAYYFTSTDTLPDYNTQSPFFTSIYYRYLVNTTYLSIGQAAFYLVMAAVGFAFVEVVNLTNSRGNPFIGKDGTYKDIKWALIIASIMFAFSGVVTLRHRYDLSNYCGQRAPDKHFFSM